jgi:CubicO group peptidase (beta-lactamase class C family)
VRKTLTLVLLMTLVSCADGTRNEETERTAAWSPEALEKARDYWTTTHESGVVVLAGHEEIANWGPTDRKIKLSSVRKSLISALYGIYVGRGALDLDKTLAGLGIDDSPDALSPTERTATVRMLMKSRSGIYHSYVGGTPAMKANQPARDSHEPGSFWYYNNWDFNALGTIFEQETDTSIGAAFQEQIGDKIGLTDFVAADVYYLEDELSAHRQYHFRMTARDLARVGRLSRTRTPTSVPATVTCGGPRRTAYCSRTCDFPSVRMPRSERSENFS